MFSATLGDRAAGRCGDGRSLYDGCMRGFRAKRIAAACAVRCCTVGLLAVGGCATDTRGREIALEYYNIGNAYLELGSYEKAARAFEARCAWTRGSPSADYNLALAYVRLGTPRGSRGHPRSGSSRMTREQRVDPARLGLGLPPGGRDEDALGPLRRRGWRSRPRTRTRCTTAPSSCGSGGARTRKPAPLPAAAGDRARGRRGPVRARVAAARSATIPGPRPPSTSAGTSREARTTEGLLPPRRAPGTAAAVFPRSRGIRADSRDGREAGQRMVREGPALLTVIEDPDGGWRPCARPCRWVSRTRREGAARERDAARPIEVERSLPSGRLLGSGTCRRRGCRRPACSRPLRPVPQALPDLRPACPRGSPRNRCPQQIASRVERDQRLGLLLVDLQPVGDRLERVVGPGVRGPAAARRRRPSPSTACSSHGRSPRTHLQISRPESRCTTSSSPMAKFTTASSVWNSPAPPPAGWCGGSRRGCSPSPHPAAPGAPARGSR